MNNLNAFSDTIELYHGSKSGLKGKIRPCSREACDFGRGFYTGEIIQQPSELIHKFSNAKLYSVIANLNGLNILDFGTQDKELWLLYIARNRGFLKKFPNFLNIKFKELDNKDLLIGLIADDSMTIVLGMFFNNQITTDALYAALTLVNLGNQYVFKTQKACDSLMVKELEYSEKDRKTAAYNNNTRLRGIENRVNTIMRKYRRTGLYFDEMLEDLERRH